jgi:hypothetical protein
MGFKGELELWFTNLCSRHHIRLGCCLMFDAPPGSVGLVLNLLIGKRAFQILNEVDEAAFQRAVIDFNEMVDVEQKFDILLYNFLEFEQELAARALRHTYRSDFSPREMMDD